MPLTCISSIYITLFLSTYLVRDNDLNNVHKAKEDFCNGAMFEQEADILACVFKISRL